MEFGSQGQPGDRETGQDAEASHASETLRTESNCSGLEGEFFNLGVFDSNFDSVFPFSVHLIFSPLTIL